MWQARVSSSLPCSWLFGCALVLGLVSAPASIAAAEERELVIAVQENPPQLSPVMIARNVAYRVLYNAYDTLLEIDYADDFDVTPGLATAWRRIDDRTIELDLRQGVKFHNGAEMTVEDVVFTFGAGHVGEGTPAFETSRAYLGTIEVAEAVDEDTVRIRTVAPDPILELRLASWMTQIVSKEAFEAAGSYEEWLRAPVGTGPYKITEFIPDERLVLEAHDDYWQGAPEIDRLVFQVVPELAARIAGLAAGDFDIITEVTPDQIGTIEAIDGVTVVGGPVLTPRSVNFDMENPVLQDVRIRRALSLAIDRQLIVDTLWDGRVSVPNGHQFPAFGALYDPDRVELVYDPDQARELVQAAGYDGTAIPYRILPNYYPAQLQTAEVIAQMWRDVGLNIDLQVKENFGQVYQDPSGIGDVSDPALFPDPLASVWRLYGPNGWSAKQNSWSNERFNELGQILATSTDTEARRAAFQEMLDIYHHEDPPATILYTLGQFYGISEAVDWTPYPAAFMDFRARNASVK